MNSITFPIAPVPKARARVTRSGHAYTPKSTKDFERAIQRWWRAHQKPLSKQQLTKKPPITVSLRFFFKRPKSHKGKDLDHRSRPDLDNLAKAVLDALNGLAWVDDSQIVALMLFKFYRPGDPCIHMYWTVHDEV